jgi:CHAT domain-containing protein
VTTIKICERDFSLPWEIFCSSSSDENITNLWGQRYVIQKHFPLNSNVYLFPTRKITRPQISLAVLRDLPYVNDEITFFQNLYSTGQIYLNILRDLKSSDDYEILEVEMDEVRSFFESEQDIAHFACHLHLSDSADSSSLIISDDFYLTPNLLDKYKVKLEGKPLLILNTCDSGILNPLQMSGFISYMIRYAGTIGVLATECKIPSEFASAFAQEFYKNFLEQGMTIGKAVFYSRQTFLSSEYNNPLGLLYSMYQVDPEYRFEIVR